MKHAHLRHLRCTRPAYGAREHFDWSANGDSLRELEPVLPPAEHIQTDPLAVINSIPLGKIAAVFVIFATLAFVAGAVLAMGAN